MQCKIFVSVLVYDKSGMPLKQLNCTEFAGTSSVQRNVQVCRTDATHDSDQSSFPCCAKKLVPSLWFSNKEVITKTPQSQ